MKKLSLLLFAALAAVVSCSKENPVPAPTGPDMVDLGLSVYWASFNVGAAKPEEYGSYFAYGDVTGQTWNGTNWSNGGFSTAPRYEKDGNGNLLPSYDAAHVKLGGSWRMPTKEDFQALIDNCTSTWVDNYNGTAVAGRVFKSKINGNSIFFPASGYGEGEGLNRFNTDGNYWSSSFDQTTDSWLLDFHSDHVYTCGYSRKYGFSVRAVVDKSALEPSAVTDLSALETANCYIVPAAGNYKFKATVKGNGSESVGTPASAEVLWESFGTNEIPYKGDIISSVSLENGYVKFSTPSSLVNGNAVIVVKDASSNILWSWHIWVCKDFYPSVSAQVYNNNAGTLMDRNLGATSAIPGDVHALGLLYQWGRKDPFLSGNSISSNALAATTLHWPSAETSDESIGTIDYAVAHPTTFINYNKNNGDWLYSASSSTDNTRWQSNKTIYDPCPAGWRVPDGGENGVWCKALGASALYDNYNWDFVNGGSDLGSGNGQPISSQLGSDPTIWYPAAGCLFGSDNALVFVGFCCIYWSCTPTVNDDGGAYYFEIDDFRLGYLYTYLPSYRAYGQSVRCIKL